MIKKFEFKLEDRHVKQINGQANELVKNEFCRALSKDVSDIVSFDEKIDREHYNDHLYTTEFLIMPQSQVDHVLSMLRVLRTSQTREGQMIVDEIKNEILYK